ncbi:hypothetical protein CYY_003215 [Polysphondylium violaceum]|uniref:Uncharacterized protein n=1 Tax=Polysphondylium violaceum TaxID=133409 RepID=A0A8J4V8X0_9MYCE|nr:hypothetical protein CYY_003215 [Polysphondylium violaceum]
MLKHIHTFSLLLSLLFVVQIVKSQQPPSTLYVVLGDPRYQLFLNTIDLQSGKQVLNLGLNNHGQLYGFVDSNLPNNLTVIYPAYSEIRKGSLDVTTGTITALESTQEPDGLFNIGSLGWSSSKDSAYLVTDSFGPRCIRFVTMDFVTGNSSIIDTDLNFDLGNASSPDTAYDEAQSTLYGVYVYQSMYHIVTFDVNGLNYTDLKTNLPAKSNYFADIFILQGQIYLMVQESNQIVVYTIDMQSGKNNFIYSTKSSFPVPDVNYFFNDSYMVMITSTKQNVYQVETLHIPSFKVVSTTTSSVDLISTEAIWAY